MLSTSCIRQGPRTLVLEPFERLPLAFASRRAVPGGLDGGEKLRRSQSQRHTALEDRTLLSALIYTSGITLTRFTSASDKTNSLTSTACLVLAAGTLFFDDCFLDQKCICPDGRTMSGSSSAVSWTQRRYQ
jgi:hypothetical protein